MKFDRLVDLILEGTKIDDIANKFVSEVLSKYQYTLHGEGHLNCAWATRTFCKWAKDKGGDEQAIVFSWPSKETLKLNPSFKEVAHIAPVYKNNIIDFTYGQFVNKDIPYKITPVNNWKDYQKFGVGIDTHQDGNKVWPQYKIDSIDSLEREGYSKTIVPPALKNKV